MGGKTLAEKKLIKDGKTKRLFSAEREDQLIIEFKDVESVFDGDKKAKFKNKGALRNNISKAIFEYLGSYNIPTHFSEKVSDKEMRVRKLNMIPLIVIIRNVAAGSLCERFKVEEGAELKYPIIEYYLKNEELNNPLILESHAYAFGYATPDEMKHISRLASKINAVLKSYLERRKLKLIDYKLEFGRYQNQIYLGNEITPDTSRLWDMLEDDKLDKEHFSFENNKAEKSYQEISQRLIK